MASPKSVEHMIRPFIVVRDRVVEPYGSLWAFVPSIDEGLRYWRSSRGISYWDFRKWDLWGGSRGLAVVSRAVSPSSWILRD